MDLRSGRVLHNVLLGPFVHANGDGEEIVRIEKIALEDEGVKEAIAKLQLPEGTVVISDPWIYGTLFSRFLVMVSTNVCRIRWCQRRRAPLRMLPLHARPP